MPETKSKRKPKFGHLKVGDDVVIGSTFFKDRGTFRVAVIDHKLKAFSVQRRASVLEGSNGPLLFSQRTGRVTGLREHCRHFIAIVAPEEEMIALRDRDNRDDLISEIRKFSWSSLTLPQLRRIRAELDAATTEPRS